MLNVELVSGEWSVVSILVSLPPFRLTGYLFSLRREEFAGKAERREENLQLI